MEYEVLGDVVAVGIDLVPPLQQLGVVDHHPVQLVAEGHPVRVDVVRPTKQLDFPAKFTGILVLQKFDFLTDSNTP